MAKSDSEVQIAPQDMDAFLWWNAYIAALTGIYSIDVVTRPDIAADRATAAGDAAVAAFRKRYPAEAAP